ncbi:MAG: hypothetical protein ACE5SW_08030 [Nitrososphaeraceae archaeon]
MSNSQEQYIESLKRIKETEERVHSEIEVHRKKVEKEIEELNNELANAISTTKLEGKKLIDTSIQQAQDNASKEADKILKDAENKSKEMSIKLDDKSIKEIINILLSGI